MKKYLTLENGDVFVGEACGDLGAEIEGELVFTTNMTGYQENLTDPSYKNQIITFTYPLIGNYGISLGTSQSDEIQASAVVVREMTDEVYHYQSVISLDAFLKQQKVPAISGIDTRQLTKIIRQYGTMKASLTNQPINAKKAEMAHQSSIVKSATRSVTDGQENEHVVVVDFGVKATLSDRYNVPESMLRLLHPNQHLKTFLNYILPVSYYPTVLAIQPIIRTFCRLSKNFKISIRSLAFAWGINC